MIRTFSALGLALLLGGCVTTGLPPATRAPICEALIGPIHYNSTKKASDYFAGRKLAPQLAQRNHVGINLGCDAYRR